MLINHAFFNESQKRKGKTLATLFLIFIHQCNWNPFTCPDISIKDFTLRTSLLHTGSAWCNTVKYVSRFHNRAQFASYPKTAGWEWNFQHAMLCRRLIELWKSFTDGRVSPSPSPSLPRVFTHVSRDHVHTNPWSTLITATRRSYKLRGHR